MVRRRPARTVGRRPPPLPPPATAVPRTARHPTEPGRACPRRAAPAPPARPAHPARPNESVADRRPRVRRGPPAGAATPDQQDRRGGTSVSAPQQPAPDTAATAEATSGAVLSPAPAAGPVDPDGQPALPDPDDASDDALVEDADED